ncbi:hypothetical protein G3545_14130 [Starkeya sp. ORNL1]|uniref:prohead protease/major capsid protein fusion protein n=1 Tax=Starkeya sp. ORNL1 TaxID=2709380 RepID=UPI0014630D27|nr:prohead protease/major capsid protein fusion protein [Starkeya sp. ORNL1]QJP14681.1 hypothetical protein G3545_14130 [Starkeya sp. ORNL1]
MKRSAHPRTTPDGFEPGASVQRGASDDMLARLAPTTYDEGARTVDAIFSTGARVRRWGIFEELAISADAIDIRRVEQGQVRLLDTHDSSSIDKVLGVVTSARVTNGQLVGSIRFSDTEAGRRAEAMVASGDLVGISVGYRVTTWTLTAVENNQEIWRADRWELLEVSLVAIPADPGAMVRNESTDPSRASAHIEESDDMRRNVTPATPTVAPLAAPSPAPAPEVRAVPAAPAAPSIEDAVRAERARVAEITTIGRAHGMADAAVTAAINAGTSIDAFRGIVLDDLAARSERTTIVNAHIGRSAENPEVRGPLLREALVARMQESSGQRSTPSDAARQYMGHSLSEMAAVAINARSMPRTARERIEVFERAFHTTSDFPIIFSGAINARLEARYVIAEPTYRRLARQQNFNDFRPHDVIRPGDFPTLLPLSQAGEIQYGTFGEKKESVIVVPYGIAINFTRQMLVNDNLGAIDEVISNQGTMVAQFEDTTFFAMKAVNSGAGPTLLEDSTAVFHTNHGNLAASVAAINVTSVSLGRAALRKQKSLGGQPIDQAPRILLVGPDKEGEAEQFTAPLQATQQSNVSIFSGKLETVVSNKITGNAWELYVDPTFGANWQWGLLDGYTAPRIRVDEPFGIQGLAVSVEHDFGCGAVDFRRGYRNTGA